MGKFEFKLSEGSIDNFQEELWSPLSRLWPSLITVIKKYAECAMPDYPSRLPTAEKENADIQTNSDSKNKSKDDQ